MRKEALRPSTILATSLGSADRNRGQPRGDFFQRKNWVRSELTNVVPVTEDGPLLAEGLEFARFMSAHAFKSGWIESCPGRQASTSAAKADRRGCSDRRPLLETAEQEKATRAGSQPRRGRAT